MRDNHPIPKPVRGWIANHSRRHYWRVAAFYEFDDLVADGIEVAWKCYQKYGVPGIELDHAHYMSLVKTAFHNKIGDLLRHHRGEVEVTVKTCDLFAELGEDDSLDRVTEQEPVSEHDYAMLLASLPPHLKRVVDLYMSDEGAKKLRRSMRVRLKGGDETMSERLAKLVGFPTNLDFERELRVFLWEQDLDTA